MTIVDCEHQRSDVLIKQSRKVAYVVVADGIENQWFHIATLTELGDKDSSQTAKAQHLGAIHGVANWIKRPLSIK